MTIGPFDLAKQLRQIALNIEGVAQGGYRPDIAKDYLMPYAQQLRSLATKCEENERTRPTETKRRKP